MTRALAITISNRASARIYADKSGPVLARIPLHRFVQPLEVANTIAYLLSDESSMVNGVSLVVDGGLLAA